MKLITVREILFLVEHSPFLVKSTFKKCEKVVNPFRPRSLKLQYQMYTYSGFLHMFFIEQFHFLSDFGTVLFFLSTCLCLYLDLFSTNSRIFVHFWHLRNLSFLVVPKFWETAQYNSRYVQESVRVIFLGPKISRQCAFRIGLKIFPVPNPEDLYDLA